MGCFIFLFISSLRLFPLRFLSTAFYWPKDRRGFVVVDRIKVSPHRDNESIRRLWIFAAGLVQQKRKKKRICELRTRAVQEIIPGKGKKRLY